MAMSVSKSNLINSAIAVGISEFVTLPISTIKTIYQNTSDKTIIDVIKKIYKEGGIRSFFRSTSASVFSQVFSTSTKYSLYKYLEDKVKFKYSSKFFNGLASGIFISVFTHPIDFVRIHHQMNGPILPIIKSEGYRVLFRGYNKTLLKSSFGTALYYPLYDYAFGYFNNIIYASIISAIISATLLQPIDYYRTRHIYSSIWYLGLRPKNLFKGLSLNLARVVPHFVIMMVLLDYFNKISQFS